MARIYFSLSLISNIEYHLFIESDDPVRWNDKIGMLAQRAQLINTFLWKAAVLRVVCRLAPRTADGNYFLYSNYKVCHLHCIIFLTIITWNGTYTEYL